MQRNITFRNIVVKVGYVIVHHFFNQRIVVAGHIRANFNAAFKRVLAQHLLTKTMNGMDAGGIKRLQGLF